MYLPNAIQKNMEVVTSCGTIVGRVERVEAGSLKLASCGPKSRDKQYWVPFDWIEAVGDSVQLNKSLTEAIHAEQRPSRPIVARRRSDVHKPKSRLRIKAVCV